MASLVKRVQRYAERLVAPDAIPTSTEVVGKSGPNFPPLASMFSNLGDGGQERPGDAHKTHAWVYACIDAITRSLSDLPLRHYKGPEDDPEPAVDRDLEKLLKAPSRQVNTQKEFISLIGIHLLARGLSFVVKMAKDGLPVTTMDEMPSELLIVHPKHMKPILVNGWLFGWKYENGRTRVNFLDFQVLFFKRPDPDNPWGGLSPLSAANAGLTDDYLAQKYNRAYFVNAGIVSGIISFAGEGDDAIVRRMKAQFTQEHSGSRNAFKVIALEQGTKFTDVKLTQRDMEFLDQRRWNRDEVIAVFGCNKHVLGLTEGYVLANAIEAEKAFYSRAILPLGGLITATMDAQWLRYRREQTWVKFDSSGLECYKANRGEAALILGRYQQAGVSLRECNRVLNLGLDLDGNEFADTIFVRRGLMPADMMWEQGTTGGTSGGGEKAMLKDAIMEAIEEGKTPEEILGILEDLDDDIVATKALPAPPMAKVTMPLELFDEGDEFLLMKEYLTPIFEDAIDKGLDQLASEIGLTGGMGWDPDEADEFAKFFGKKWNKVKTIPKNLHKRMKKKVRKAIAAGDTVEEITQELDKFFKISKKGYSGTIARTEVGDVLDNTRYIGMEKEEVPSSEWITAGFGVRDSHISMDGQVRKLGEKFISGAGNSLLHPHDPNAPAGESVNCRCVQVPVFDDDKTARPDMAKSAQSVAKPLEKRAYNKTLGWYKAIFETMKKNIRKANK